jgi:hypothetical protein
MIDAAVVDRVMEMCLLPNDVFKTSGVAVLANLSSNIDMHPQLKVNTCPAACFSSNSLGIPFLRLFPRTMHPTSCFSLWSVGCTVLQSRNILPVLMNLATFDIAKVKDISVCLKELLPSFFHSRQASMLLLWFRVQGQAAVALCSLTANPAMRSWLIEKGAVAVLIGLARSSSETTKQECAQVCCLHT